MFRALVVWGVVSFAVLQVYEPLMHGLHLPDWTLSFVVVVLGMGFPVTAVLSWLFDLKASGIERTAPIGAGGSPALRLGGLRLPALLLGLGAAAAAPGVVYFFVWPGTARRAAEAAAGPASGPSIAVLPFVNLSSDKEQEYFSDGVAEEILNALAQVGGLRVTARTSSFAMKGKTGDLRAIARELNVGNLLEGSVRRSGTRVRITAQLVEAAAGTHLWSQEFDGDLGDTFAVQEKIANAVAAALKLKLLPTAQREPQSSKGEAHDMYLLGLTLLAKGSGDGYGRAVAALHKAIEIDPGYAQAWAALASALFAAADQDVRYSPKVNWPKAQAAADRAIALAPDLADGYAARAQLRQMFLMDWEGARADLERARALNPGAPRLLEEYAVLLTTLGRMPEAVPLLQRAALLDPLSAEVPTSLAIAYLGSGQLPLAAAAAAHALELEPEHGRAARTLGFALLLQGRLDEARTAFHRSSNDFFRAMGDAMVDHSLGRAAESQRALDSLLALPVVRKGSYQVAQIYAWRGEADRAFEWLGYAVEERDPGLTYLKRDPVMRALRGDPRYAALVRKLNLPEG